MNIEAQPLGNEYRFDGKESDIVEVQMPQTPRDIIAASIAYPGCE